LHDLAVDLVALGHEPRVITGHDAPTQRTVEDGFEVVRLRRSWRTARLRVELARDDVAIATQPRDVLAAPHPVVFAGMGMAGPATGTRLVRAALRRADAFVTLSEAGRASAQRWLGVDSHVIRPGVDLRAFTPGGARAAEPTIACAADPADPRKRVGELVAAFARVREVHPTARLVLQAPERPELAAPGVEFDDGPVLDLYRRAWVSGLASVDEAFGLVLVESLACGTPVFARSDGGGREIVTDDVGVLFDDDLAGALLRALELDPARCRARAEAFPSRATAAAYVELLKRITPSSSRTSI
jgi:glycosyltransferase involved in cell wall biosynthesis